MGRKFWSVSSFTIAIGTILMVTSMTSAQSTARYMEKLDRGLIAVKSGSGYYLSWRLFGTDPQDNTFGFNVYKGSTKLNSTPITDATCYQDNGAGTGAYTVKPITIGVEGAASEAARVLDQNYLSISLQVPPGGKTPAGEAYTYAANDCSIGDLDGDGDYEIVLKWDPSNSKDNAFSGYTGNTILDAYKLNGTRLWRIDLGKNIRSGAHYTQFMVYDLDGDGKAEVVCKTADGAIDGKGKIIGDANVDWRAKDGYTTTKDGTGSRTLSDGTMVADLVGRIMSGPEYLTVFNGQTGAADTTIDYQPPLGTVSSWGDLYCNRSERYLACIAYLDGVQPSAVMCRGYYARTALWALDYRNGKLIQRWLFDSNVSGAGKDGKANGTYGGQGCHSIREGDVDGDGFDEIVYGSCTIDHDGQGLYTTRLGHGDALHLADMDPDRPGLEVWQVHESPAGNGGIDASFRDAKTGAIIWSDPGTGDNGRGCCGPLVAGLKGWQMWSTVGGLWDVSHNKAGNSPSSDNFTMWWDGSLNRATENSNSITKYGGGNLLTASGCTSNNGTKSTPCLTADIFGDWREEVIYRTNDNSALRIYTTTTPTTNRLYTLMHDPSYRMSVASENVVYNQPPEPGIYIGPGMTLPEAKPNIRYYDGTMVSPDVVYVSSQKSMNASMRIFGNRPMALPVQMSGMLKRVTVYDCAGKLLIKAVVKNNIVNLQKDFGLSNGLYLLRINTVDAKEKP
jgi:rhamnogalacturonan endolyase